MMKRFKITKVARTLAIAATATAGILTSCTDYSEFTEAELKHQEDLKSYTEMFKAMFGEFDPNHTWGMNTPIRCMQSVGGSMMGTRANSDPYGKDSGSVDVNVNMWVNHNVAGGTAHGPYEETALAHDIQIPGWPHLNGLYYGNTGGSTLGFARTAEQLQNGNMPCGDITEYEIQYVSSWFRTHKDPESISLHLSDFFIQNVSADADQLAYDNTTTNPNECTIGENGGNIEFATQGGGRNITIKSAGSNERINYKLDQLCFKAIGGSDNPNMDSNGWTHANNFNNGNVNFNPEENPGNNFYREIKYITSSGTEDFACRSSMNSNNTAWTKKWVLVHLTWTEKVVDPSSPYLGRTFDREGYYLAFDFETETNQTKVEGDGYYSNWIIKITPGHFTPESGAMRVFCEDLGGALDFDFNDAVFDVGFDKNGQTIVQVRATGATMPIYIGYDPTDGSGQYAPGSIVKKYEIHNLLENVSGEMKQINVKDGSFATHAPAIFRGETYSEGNRLLKNLNMYVVNNRGANKANPLVYRLNSNHNDRMGFDSPEDSNNGTAMETWDVAPRAFAVPVVDTENPRWMVEYINIKEGYSGFADWCQNADATVGAGVKWWEVTPSVGDDILYRVVTHNAGSVDGDYVVPLNWVELTIPTDVTLPTDVAKLLKLHAWSGNNPIWRALDALSDSNHEITFSIAMESTELLPVDGEVPFKCVLIPADYSNSNITYQNYTASETEFANVITKWKAPEIRSMISKEDNKEYYVFNFKFKKNELYTVLNQAGQDNKICDYLLLYMKDNSGNIITGDSTVKVTNWFVRY